MKHLKLSLPTTRHVDLSQYMGNADNRVGEWVIHPNDGIREADAWVVIEGAPSNDNLCLVPDGALMFATAEVIQPDNYYLSSPSRMRFLQQFDRILTCHPILLDKVERHIPFLPWMINSNHGPSITNAHARDLNVLQAMKPIEKTRCISVICSTKTLTPEQELRLRFVDKLTERFRGQIDWFGNGRQPIAEKWDAIAPYRYSIAIENKRADDVITEKIQDVFLGFAMPIYWGAPNVSEHFDTAGLREIDIRDWRSACQVIERILDEDPFASSSGAILENRNRVLHELHFLRRLARAAESTAQGDRKRMRVVHSEAGTGVRLRRAIGRSLRNIGDALST